MIVEVIYATPEYQRIFTVEISSDNNDNNTIFEIITKSGILEYYPEIDLNINKVGIYSDLKKLTDIAHGGDRIEIYRELLIDPIEARRRRADKQK